MGLAYPATAIAPRAEPHCSASERSLVPLELPFSPMRVFARGIKRPFDVPVQCPHDTDAGEHRRPAIFHDQQQRLHRGLPFGVSCSALGNLVNSAASRRVISLLPGNSMGSANL